MPPTAAERRFDAGKIFPKILRWTDGAGAGTEERRTEKTNAKPANGGVNIS